jgi:L-aminopeptidase/D-esterase-like protein
MRLPDRKRVCKFKNQRDKGIKVTTFKIGHYTDTTQITGCTVILCPPQTVASCYIPGSAPGSRELALLAPERKIEHVHAVLLTGGSAFGLHAAAGVMQYLEEQKTGYETLYGRIPLVPAAVVYDLNIGSPTGRPLAVNGYEACLKTGESSDQEGSVGAGTGATVGKWAGLDSCLKGGLGIAEVFHEKVQVRALAVVNAVGDIQDEGGNIIAGAHDGKGNFLAAAQPEQRWQAAKSQLLANTVLCVIMTNARLNKIQAYNLARRGQNGLARAVVPATTGYDGDVIFALAAGDKAADIERLGAMAELAVQRSIMRAVRKASGLGGIPSVSDFNKNKEPVE